MTETKERGSTPVLDMHVLLYINQGLKVNLRAFSPTIIIEDLYLQRFFHRPGKECPAAQVPLFFFLIVQLRVNHVAEGVHVGLIGKITAGDQVILDQLEPL